MKIKRGVVLRPTIQNGNMNAKIDEQLIRMLALFWDIMDYPIIKDNNSGIVWGPNERFLPEHLLLKQEGILQESYVAANDNGAKVVSSRDELKNIESESGTTKSGVINSVDRFISPFGVAQIELCKHKNSTDSNTSWSIGDLNDDISKMFFGNKDKEAIQMEFYNFLPVPSKEVPLEKILDFKSKRDSELLHIRAAVDELSNAVFHSENLEDELKRKKEEIDKCLLDLHRILDENKIQKICSNLNTYLNIKEIELSKLIPQVAAASLITSNLEFGLLLGIGVNVLLKIGSKKVSKIDSLPENLRNYIYVYDTETKLN